MPKKFKLLIVFFVLGSIGFLAFKYLAITNFDGTYFLSFKPRYDFFTGYIAFNSKFNNPVVYTGNFGVYNDATDEKYASNWYEKWSAYLDDSQVEQDAYWSDWAWDKKIVMLHLTGISTVDGTINFNFIRPEFVNGQDSLKDVTVTCDKSNTFVLNKSNLSIVKSEVDFFQESNVGTVLYTKCNNERCDVVGNDLCGIVANE